MSGIENRPLGIESPDLDVHLRQMARAGATVRGLVEEIRRVYSGPDVTFAVVFHFRRAFELTVGEARLIEGSTLLGGASHTPERTEHLMRPLIDRHLGTRR